MKPSKGSKEAKPMSFDCVFERNTNFMEQLVSVTDCARNAIIFTFLLCKKHQQAVWTKILNSKMDLLSQLHSKPEMVDTEFYLTGNDLAIKDIIANFHRVQLLY